MPAKPFLDSNILIYLYSETETEKAQQALVCAQANNAWISTQVLNEVSNVLRRKRKLPYTDVLRVIQELRNNFFVHTVTPDTIEQALQLGERYGYSYFDSLMLASALEQGCDVLYSEDLQHGQKIADAFTIQNTFISGDY